MTQKKREFSFTQDRLKSLPPHIGNDRDVYYDAKTVGLQLRVTKNGTKTFSFYRRVKGGAPVRATLGKFPPMTIDIARAKAAAINAAIEDGANPAAAKRAHREEMTFQKVFDEFLVNKRKRKADIGLAEKTKKDYSDLVRLHLGPISKQKLSLISRDQVSALHTKISMASKAQANKAVALISSVFSYAKTKEYFKGESPTEYLQMNSAVQRERFVNATEMPYVIGAIELSSLADFFKISLLTGVRRSNLQEMSWREVDLSSGTWRIPKTKNGDPQTVPLIPEVIEILQARKQAAPPGEKFVFPGTGKTGHLVEPKTSWAAVLRLASFALLLDAVTASGEVDEKECDEIGALSLSSIKKGEERLFELAAQLKLDPLDYQIRDLRIHDLRRTLGSWQTMTGTTLPVVGKTLGHKTPQATMIYARMDLSPVRESVEVAVGAMRKAASRPGTSKVLTVKRQG